MAFVAIIVLLRELEERMAAGGALLFTDTKFGECYGSGQLLLA